jgi:hypothetical protein
MGLLNSKDFFPDTWKCPQNVTGSQSKWPNTASDRLEFPVATVTPQMWI